MKRITSRLSSPPFPCLFPTSRRTNLQRLSFPRARCPQTTCYPCSLRNRIANVLNIRDGEVPEKERKRKGKPWLWDMHTTLTTTTALRSRRKRGRKRSMPTLPVGIATKKDISVIFAKNPRGRERRII